MKQLLFVLVAFAFVASASIASAASTQDVNAVIGALSHRSNKLVSFRGDKTAFKAVYITRGKRYTATCSAKTLSIWVRPTGKVNTKVAKALEDKGLDGKVDLGFEGTHVKDMDLLNGSKGREHLTYWQNEYDTAIGDALNHFQ